MSQENSPKKSETIEVRIPYPTKTAFMRKAKAEGRAASEIVREQIDAYLSQPEPPQDSRARAMAFLRKNLRSVGLLLAGAGSALAIAVATSPATAQPDLETAFTTLDANGDGAVSLGEFTNARPDGGNRAYVRYMLASDSTDGDMPLLLAIDLPQGKVDEAQLAKLIGAAFDRLDRNGDGHLSADEIRAG